MNGAECQHWRMLLDDHLSGELLVETTRELLRHVDRCGACRDELAAREKIRRALRRRLTIETPATLEHDVTRCLIAQGSDALAKPPRRGRRWMPLVAVAAGLALVVIAAPSALAAIRSAVSSVTAVMSRTTPPLPPPPPIEPLVSAPPGPLAQPSPLARTPTIPSARPAANLVDLELEALWRLHQAGALIGEEVAFARGDRTLSIRARVDSDGRKATLQHALGPIALAGAQVRVETFAEAAARSRASAPGKIIFQDLGALADRAAASPLLAAYFAKQFGAETDPRVREASRAFSTRVLDAARQSTLHAFALKRIAGRFAAQDLERASDAARVTYQVLVREYAGVVESSARELTRDLESLFGGGTASTDSPAGAPSIEALATQAAELERAMDAAFAVQAGGSPAVAPDGERLLSLVRSLQRTAAAVREGSSQQVGR